MEMTVKKEWGQHKIKDFGVVSTGTTPSTKNKDYYGGPYKLISPADLSDAKYIFSANKYVTEEGLKFARKVPAGAILVGCIGNVGKIGITKDPVSAFNQQINAIVCNDNFDPDFVYYLLRYQRPLLESKASKVTLPILNKSNFENIEFEVPELSEQKLIAKKLAAIQGAISGQEELVTKLKELKRSMMQHLFAHGTKGEKTKMTEIGEIPESWEVVELGSVCKEIIGGGTPSTKVKSYWAGENPWITSKWLGEKMYLSDGEKMISDEAIKKSATHMVPENSLIFATRVGVGKVGINKIPVAINQDLAGIVVSQGIDVLFLAYQLRLERVHIYVNSLKRGATIQGITRDNLKKTSIVLPKKDEQLKITEMVVLIDQKIEMAQRKLSAYQDLFKTLLHELMSGEKKI